MTSAQSTWSPLHRPQQANSHSTEDQQGGNEQHRIVVGVDFGTTYSALAWASSAAPEALEVVHNWPTTGQLVGLQCPSEISYAADDNTADFSWGYNIDPRAKKIKWFKLGLEMEDAMFALPRGLQASDVVQDYLSALYKHIMTTLHRRFDRGVMAATRIDFVLTVPAIWSDAAKQKTRAAATSAGMGNEHALELLSEPESAALYTLKTLRSTHAQIKVGDRIVVCDAGGGTVDLITYDVQRVYPNLSVKECTAGTGDLCGSTFIDGAFDKLFERRMGQHYERLSIRNKQQVTKNFELAKVAFRNDDGYPTYWVNVPTVNDIEETGVIGGNFAISQEEMRALFDPVIEKVIDLIKEQVTLVSTGTDVVNSILLVGGFGESEYLYQRVLAWASRYDIQVIQPRDASTAIVRGAVLKGMEPKSGPSKTEILRRARRSYGVPTCRPYIEGVHLPEDMFISPETGKKLARNQVSWFIRKNEVVTDDKKFRHSFTRHFRHIVPWIDSLVSSTLEVPPRSFSDPSVQKHCTITSDLTHLKKYKFRRHWHKIIPYYTAEYELLLRLKGNNLTMALEYIGREYGVAQIDFEQE